MILPCVNNDDAHLIHVAKHFFFFVLCASVLVQWREIEYMAPILTDGKEKPNNLSPSMPLHGFFLGLFWPILVFSTELAKIAPLLNRQTTCILCSALGVLQVLAAHRKHFRTCVTHREHLKTYNDKTGCVVDSVAGDLPRS